MGNILSSCACRKHRINSLKEITLLMIGLDNAGKTCTAKHLLKESTSDAVPTVGFSRVQLRHGRYNVSIYDVGGGPKIRGIWKSYYALVHGIIFVVDASDAQRFTECKNEIANVLKDQRIAGKPMLLLINKQDIEGAINETELVNQLDLETIVNEQKCPTRVEASCAIYEEKKVKDPGIQEGFDWLIGHIGKDFKMLHERVEREKEEQRKREEKETAERLERVRKIREEREKAEENQEKNGNIEDEHDDDDDVIEGNPFKPVKVIKAELEKKKINVLDPFPLIPGIKVIHVSPTKSSENKEEIILHPRTESPALISVENQPERIATDTFTNSTEMVNGFACEPSYLCSVSKSEEGTDEKKKGKKPKKRFKNRVMPCEIETPSSFHISRVSDLPPLKSPGDAVLNHPPSYISPKRHLHNGQMNWALADELIPVDESSGNAGYIR